MNTTESQRESSKRKNPPQFELDKEDIDLESLFEFRPITKGLGFHHEQDKKVHKKTVMKAPSRNYDHLESKKIIPSELKAFYSDQGIAGEQEKEEVFTTSKKDEHALDVIINSAKPIERMMAWMFDLGLITTGLFSVLILAVVSSGIRLDVLTAQFSSIELVSISLIAFSGFYFLYFSIFDLGGSPGKNLLGLKLISTQKSGKQRVSIKQTTIRSFVGLLSLFLAAFPFLFDFHGKLSDTQVVKEDDNE